MDCRGTPVLDSVAEFKVNCVSHQRSPCGLNGRRDKAAVPSVCRPDWLSSAVATHGCQYCWPLPNKYAFQVTDERTNRQTGHRHCVYKMPTFAVGAEQQCVVFSRYAKNTAISRRCSLHFW